MRVCLICTEFFGWGASGGFGYAARVLGRELVKRGVEVCAVVPRPRGVKEIGPNLDGVQIYSFPRASLLNSGKLYRHCDADIYLSIQASSATYIAWKTMPDRKHIINFQDPRDRDDWKVEFSHASHGRLQMLLTYLYYENFFTRSAVRHSDGLYCPAKYLIGKARDKYGLAFDPGFLPTPVSVPDAVQKSDRPTVCFLGRLDKIKRPAIFLDLARRYPSVTFKTIGGAVNQEYERNLRAAYADLSNIEWVGFIDQFTSSGVSDHLSKSWILVNTSAKEGLPNTFIEGAAHRCAILGAFNPDGFTSEFGYYVTNDDYEKGLNFLLENDRWKERGRLGYEYVLENYESGRVIDNLLAEFELLVSRC